MSYSRVAGTGSYLPEKILTNKEIESMVDTTDEWITDRSGIRQRHIAAKNETASTMACAASKKALEAAGIDKNAIDLIVVGTSTPDKIFPSTACLLQQQLGISGCPAFDVNAACASFNYALSVADQFIRGGTVKTALVVGSETMSRIVDWEDRGTCVLFADGAGAMLLQAGDEPGILSTHIHAAGEYGDLLYAPSAVAKNNSDEPPYIKMRGREVFKMAVNTLGTSVTEALTANNVEQAGIDWLIPHQANLRIIKATAQKLSLPMEQVIVTIDKHGNTSSASVPLALDIAVRDGRIKRGDMLLLESFGGGFAWGSALIQY